MSPWADLPDLLPRRCLGTPVTSPLFRRPQTLLETQGSAVDFGGPPWRDVSSCEPQGRGRGRGYGRRDSPKNPGVTICVVGRFRVDTKLLRRWSTLYHVLSSLLPGSLRMPSNPPLLCTKGRDPSIATAETSCHSCRTFRVDVSFLCEKFNFLFLSFLLFMFRFFPTFLSDLF